MPHNDFRFDKPEFWELEDIKEEYPALFKKLRRWHKKHVRPSWTPVTKAGDGHILGSKFCGLPALPDGQWPTCGFCNGPLQLFLQLALNDIPSNADRCLGTGLLQFYFCTNQSAECFAKGYGDPFAPNQLVRRIPATASNSDVTYTSDVDALPARTITGWTAHDDFPYHADRELLGLRYAAEKGGYVECAELGLNFEIDVEDYFACIAFSAPTITGDKLGGWPAWLQNIEFPECPRCRQTMDKFVFQIDSNDNIPFSLANGGRGQILQCPRDTDVFSFVWASG